MVRFQHDGLPVLEPDIAGVDGVIARLIGIVFTAMIDGTWERLKVCRNERCQKAFYDTSKKSFRGMVFNDRVRESFQGAGLSPAASHRDKRLNAIPWLPAP
jgi:hypothetical protein